MHNLITSCKSCNSSKGARTIREWMEYKQKDTASVVSRPVSDIQIIVHHTESNTQTVSNVYIPYPERLLQLSEAIIRDKGIRTKSLSGSGRLFTRTECDFLVNSLVSSGLATWKNENHHNVGMEITKQGWSVFANIAGVDITEVTTEMTSAIIDIAQDDAEIQEEKIAQENDAEETEAEYTVDALYDQALELVVNEGRGSTTLLQRKLRIGYSRAARIMDQLESAGILGKYSGSGHSRSLLSENKQPLLVWREPDATES